MANGLKGAMEALYLVFSVYPLPTGMVGCPCCVSGADREKIHGKELKLLTDEDLSKYAFKAMSTWGDVDDYKYYLPRILELLATTGIGVDTFVLLNKLEYGNWRTWAQREQEAIERVLFEWWADRITKKGCFDGEVFFGVLGLTHNIDRLLEGWQVRFEDGSFACYVDFVHDYYHLLVNRESVFKEIDVSFCDKLMRWIDFNSKKLEEGFFYYEAEGNTELAGRISTVLYVLEATPR